MKLVAATICINYSDYLECVIGNARHFDRWLVVTVPEDVQTRELCAKHGVEVLLSKVLRPDGKDFDAAYHKSAVLNEALDVLSSADSDAKQSAGEHATWCLLVDADVLLPRDFRARVEGLPLEAGTLYGAAGRKIVQEREAFEQIRDIEPWTTLVARNSNVIGYFNLFCLGATPNRYPVREAGTKEGAHDDWHFTMSFDEDHRAMVPMTVIHTGWPWTNWSGRKSDRYAMRETGFGMRDVQASGFASVLNSRMTNAAVIGYFPGGRWRELVRECAKVWMIDHFQVHTPSGHPMWEADRAVLRRLFAAETAGMDNLAMLGAHGLEQLAQIPDGSLDLLVLPGEVAPDWLAAALPYWQAKLREGAVVCGDLFGHPWWREATFSLALLLGAPDGVSADGRWWKRMGAADRKLTVPQGPATEHDGVVLVNRSKDTMDALLLSLFSVRKHWLGPVLAVHWGEEDPSLAIACARQGVELWNLGEFGADAEDWPAGVAQWQPFKRALVVQPGMLAVSALEEVFAEKCAITAEGVPLLVEGGEAMAAKCGFATEFTGGPEAMVVFSGEPETWTEEAWQLRSELEAEAAIAMAGTVRVPRDTTIACIIARDEMEEFQRNWLTWRFPPGTPVLLVLAGFSQEEFWLPEATGDVRIASLALDQANNLPWLLKTIATACRTSEVVFVSASSAALPGAELWAQLKPGETVVHFSPEALEEVKITGNRFVPSPCFARMSVARLESLANSEAAAKYSHTELSLLLHEAASPLQSDLRKMGWRITGAHFFLPETGRTSRPQATTEIVRKRADGLWQLADDVVVISLPERTDRREKLSAMMEREQVWFRFVDGVRVRYEDINDFEASEVHLHTFKLVGGPEKFLQGVAGCRRAHLRVFEAALRSEIQSLLVIEDDMLFVDDWLARYRESLVELPEGWLQMYLSTSNYREAEPFSKNLRRLRGSYQTTAILYSRAGIEAAYKCLRTSRCEIDVWMGNHMHPFGCSYGIEPRIACQQGGYSDIMSFDRGTTA